jgi:tripeptidyl-peptidase-1
MTDNAVSQCLRTAYQTLNYTVQVPHKQSIGINNYLNETQRLDDLKQFMTLYRPDAVDFDLKFTIIDNGANYQGPNISYVVAQDVDIEGDLDGEQVVSIAYPIPVKSFNTGGSPPFVPDDNTPTDTNEPYLSFLNYALAQDDLPLVFSSSYGDDEQTVPYSYAKRACSSFAQLGARGISYFVSSGDAGVGNDGSVGFCLTRYVRDRLR